MGKSCSALTSQNSKSGAEGKSGVGGKNSPRTRGLHGKLKKYRCAQAGRRVLKLCFDGKAVGWSGTPGGWWAKKKAG